MLPPLPYAPPDETSNVTVLVGSKRGAGRLPGIRNASSRKFRPFRGRLSISADPTTPCTSDCVVFRTSSVPVTSTTSPALAIFSETSSVKARPTSRRTSLNSLVANPDALTRTV